MTVSASSSVTTTLPPRKRAKTQEEKEQRRVERILRNRRAAHASREKKRRHVEFLENYVTGLETSLREYAAAREKHELIQAQLVARVGELGGDTAGIDLHVGAVAVPEIYTKSKDEDEDEDEEEDDDDDEARPRRKECGAYLSPPESNVGSTTPAKLTLGLSSELTQTYLANPLFLPNDDDEEQRLLAESETLQIKHEPEEDTVPQSTDSGLGEFGFNRLHHPAAMIFQ